MSNHTDNLAVKIESGQILNPNSFPFPNELVCVQVKKVFDQISVRDCVTSDIVLEPGPYLCRSNFVFEKAIDFNITEVKVLSKTDSNTKPGFKTLKLSVKIRYNIFYYDGVNYLKQPDEVTFYLTINDIYCPSCSEQIGVIHYPNSNTCPSNTPLGSDGLLINVDALVEVLNDIESPCTGALILQIGAFFLISCVCNVELLIPSYGYCPFPPEQCNLNIQSIQNCSTFNDKTSTHFPLCFFPEQKLNPLDTKQSGEFFSECRTV